MISYIKTTLATENILLSKLYAYGIKGSPIKWFESFFCNRTQYVKINDVESNIKNYYIWATPGFYSGTIAIASLY